MHDYTDIKIKYGSSVSQTLDQPVMILDFWEFQDLGLAVGVLFLGTLTSEWVTTTIGLFVVGVILPFIKKEYPKGIILHWPYRHLGMSLPGFINPRVSHGKKRKYSD